MISLFPVAITLFFGSSRQESITDSLLIASIRSECAHELSAIPTNNDWSLATSPNSDSVLVFVNGTGKCVLPASIWRRLDSTQAMERIGSANHTGLPTLWETAPRYLRNWRSAIQPQSGFGFQTDWSAGVSKGSGYVRVQENTWKYDHPLGEWFTLGLNLRRTSFSYRFQTDSVSSTPGTKTWTDFGFTLCGPVLCYQAKQQSAPLTADSWLQSQLDTLIQSGATGNVIHRWKSLGKSTVSGNWEHSLHAHFARVHWDARWDNESWSGLLQEVSLQNLPAGAIQWGVLLGWHKDLAWTGFTVSTRPITWRYLQNSRFPLKLDVTPIELAVRYRSLDQASLHAGLQIHVSNTPQTRRP